MSYGQIRKKGAVLLVCITVVDFIEPPSFNVAVISTSGS